MNKWKLYYTLLFPGFIYPMVSESVVWMQLLWKDEDIIRYVVWLEVGGLNGWWRKEKTLLWEDGRTSHSR